MASESGRSGIAGAVAVMSLALEAGNHISSANGGSVALLGVSLFLLVVFWAAFAYARAGSIGLGHLSSCAYLGTVLGSATVCARILHLHPVVTVALASAVANAFLPITGLAI